MKIYHCILLYFSVVFSLCCSDDKTETVDPIGKTIDPVSSFSANQEDDLEIKLRWKNPSDQYLNRIELAYIKEDGHNNGYTPNPLLINADPGKVQTQNVCVSELGKYQFSITAVNIAGVRSASVSIDVTVEEINVGDPDNEAGTLIAITDTLMTALIEHFKGGPRNVWRGFPKPDGYWDGDALVWGQGAGLSAFAATREASSKNDRYKKKYAEMDMEMLRAIDVFRVIDQRNGIEAYSVYPQSGNERYYDDNVWIGIDMVDLYEVTDNYLFLNRAKLVWDYLLTGTDTDGGVFWRELPDKSTSKHACSTAPRAVLSAKMYLATDEEKYLEAAKESYRFCIDVLQDKNDYLIADLQREDGSIDYAKYSYNSGQVIQAAALLYSITGDDQYLTEAKQIAQAAYQKWFYDYYSLVFGREIKMSHEHTWFNAVALRGFIELYKVDGVSTFVDGYREMLLQGWYSTCRNKTYNILNYDSFKGGVSQSSWDILHVGATVEMFARLAALELGEKIENTN